MIWVRLWAKGSYAAQEGTVEERFELWESRDPTDEELKDCAMEFGESLPGLRDLERGFKYGFERVPVLDEKTRNKLIRRYENQIKAAETTRIQAEKVLALLLEKPPGTRTRFKRSPPV